MEPNKILSASILDLVFDDRNKDYGAYELRVTYPERIKKSLLFVFAIAAVALTGAALANKLKPEGPGKIKITSVDLTAVKPNEDKPIPPPEPKKPEQPPPVRTEKLTEYNIVPDEKADDVPEQKDFDNARIDVKQQAGIDPDGMEPAEITKGNATGIIEPQKDVSDEPFRAVEVDAKFDGNWEKFLLKNLNPNTPSDNSAPAGKYKVLIQFVVDLEGNVSDIKALTNHGYGLEQEAIRVIKKATKWIPANQNGRPVKAYRVQPITFEVPEE